MKQKDLYKQIMEYLDGGLQHHSWEELQKELIQKGMNIDELEDLRLLNKELESLESPEPSQKMHERIYAMFEEEKNKQREENSQKPKGVYFLNVKAFNNTPIAAAIVLVFMVLGFLLGRIIPDGRPSKAEIAMMNNELNKNRQLAALTLLDEGSASERIKAVNLTNKLIAPDEKLLSALVYTLQNDPSDNVRLMALETLLKYSDRENIRNALVQSIPYQNSPMVQLALADGMVLMNEERSVPIFQKILKLVGVNQIVRERLQQAIEYLS